MLLMACNSAAPPPPAGGYRTITVDPRRDTENARRYNQEGTDLLEKGQLDQAAAAFTKALDADVEFGPAHNNLGKVYYRQKASYKAAWEFEYASKLLPRFSEPHNNLGLVLEESGQIDQAVEQYRLAVSLSTDIQYKSNLARGLLRRDGHTEEVRALLRQVLSQDPRPDWQDWARKELATTGQ
jgi:Tfp pilus assembly protein PilF